jgi:hypothetical protein
VDLSLQYSTIDGLKACYVTTDGYSVVGDPPVTYHFRKFNDDVWRVKELGLYYGDNMLGRFFWGGVNQTPGSVDYARADGQARTTFEFVYSDGTVECFAASVPWYYHEYNRDHVRKDCPTDVSPAICPTHPLAVFPIECASSADCTSDPNSTYQWQCKSGVCLHHYKDIRCQDLYTKTTIQLQTRSNGLILLGFRLNDCSRNPVVADANDLVIVENDLLLENIETRANMTRMKYSINFVQLMIGMCPRTLVVIEEVIEGLYSFVNTSNMDTTYIALSAFDGAKDFVNLLNFTRNISAIHAAFDNLRNYNQRDSSCNVKQSVLSMLRAFKTSTIGQPWDRKFLVIFSASIDITNYISDFDTSIEFSSDREVFTFFISLSIPQSQWPLFSAIGNAGFFTLARETAIHRHFVYVGKVAKYSFMNEYVMGYCSPSRTNTIKAKLSLSLPSNDNAYIQQFPFNAAGFGGKCSTANILSELCDCSKYDASSVKHGTVLCYECYTKSFYISGSNTQAILLYPNGGSDNLVLHLSTGHTVAPFDVYLRKGGVCSAWLYDTVLNVVVSTSLTSDTLHTSQATLPNNIEIPLEGFILGDVVGVYFDFKGNQYDMKLSIAASMTNPPVYSPVPAPVSTPIVDPPIDPPTTTMPPVGSKAPIVINAPFAPIATPFAKIPVALAPSAENSTEITSSASPSTSITFLALMGTMAFIGLY